MFGRARTLTVEYRLDFASIMQNVDDHITQDHMDKITRHALRAVMHEVLGHPLIWRLRSLEKVRRWKRRYHSMMQPILKEGT